eukprot:UN13081
MAQRSLESCSVVVWSQEMVFNTYHHTRTYLDKKIKT